MKYKINLFEPEDTPARIHIGLRTIKTVLTVFICAMFGFWRGQMAFFSMTAGVLCMQNTAGKTLETAFNQLLGTIIGALFGLLVLYLEQLTTMRNLMPVYYLLCSLMLIPIILVTLVIKKPSISALACVVFLGIAVYQLDNSAPWMYALNRTLDSFIGIVAALIINITLPNRSLQRSLDEANKLSSHPAPEKPAPDYQDYEDEYTFSGDDTVDSEPDKKCVDDNKDIADN